MSRHAVLMMAVGENHARAAKIAARRFGEINGVDVVVETDAGDRPSAHWRRLDAFRMFPDAEWVTSVDADIWAVAPCGLLPADGKVLKIGRDITGSHQVKAECQRFHLPEDDYCNTGLWTIHRSARGVLDRALQYGGGKMFYGSWWEQTAMNAAIDDLVAADQIDYAKADWNRLLFPGADRPYEMGELMRKYPGALNLHFTSLSGNGRLLARMFEAFEGRAR